MESSDETLTVKYKNVKDKLVVRDIFECPQYTVFIKLYSASSKIQIEINPKSETQKLHSGSQTVTKTKEQF